MQDDLRLCFNVFVPRPEIIKTVFMLNSAEQENSILGRSEPEKAKFLDIFTLMSIEKFMLSWVEHGKGFITLRPDLHS